mmetsp:Transcript_16822/g.58692  ORF Transcript_16822/g.58692 Transcript_16822/m.58692 type:complete len:221 (+) Transcript_16822:96-758(+)|eukprot:CAMPEP_0203883974 /NCGR_PEP_ID=MMETSP0359-20131031/28044_1 /ASSEMBLY_ACC=CAM_ASM_000338 /TAXON_ID=268821 /ORGANISM="Scrippsiella Hangoei, Strain SHTV-5" /LENGTH=220 /DNA_ID=CAMNT_0050804329 /DNA_START=93 /DNA_END=755 /DNA_ORIENTATION=+
MELFTRSFYTSHIRAVRQLIEEPDDSKVAPGEPVLEVVISSAELWLLPQETEASFLHSQSSFVRLWMDGEMVGETSVCAGAPDFRRPSWGERLLVLPRGSLCTRLELCIGDEQSSHVRGFCAYGTEGLWRAAESSGRLELDAPVLHGQAEAGMLRLVLRMWDGLPLQAPAEQLGVGAPQQEAGQALAAAEHDEYGEEEHDAAAERPAGDSFLSWASSAVF